MKRVWVLLFALVGGVVGCPEPEEAPPPAEPGWFDHPQALAFVDGLLVVANSGYRPDGWAPGSLTVIDPASGERLARVPTGALNPQALTVDGDRVWVVSTGALDLSDFDRPRVGTPGALEVFAAGALRAEGSPSAAWAMPALADDDRIGAPLSLALGAERAVLGSALANVVWVLDRARGDWSRGPADPVRLDDEYALGLGAVRAWAEGFVVVDYNADAVTLLDPAGRPVGCTVEVGAVPGELEGAGSPVVGGETLYVVLDHAGRLVAVDLRALADECRAEVRTVVSGLGAVPNHLVLHDERLYVVHSGDNTVVAYGLDGREAERWVLPVGSNPWHVAIDGRWMAVTEWAAHAVTLVDRETGEVRRIAGAPLPTIEPPDDAPDDPGGEPAAADVVVDAHPVDLDAPTGDPARAVNGVRGAGERAGSVDVFSLGHDPDDRLVLAWSGRRVVDGPGADFVVFENAFRHSGGVFVDPMIVELSRDGESWVSWPHDYLGPDGVFVDDPAVWSGFAGLTPVGLHVEDNPVDPFSAAAGGDRFDLAALPDDGEAGRIKREGFVHLRIVSAAARVDPDTGERFVRDPVSNGADVDGVYARYFHPIDP